MQPLRPSHAHAVSCRDSLLYTFSWLFSRDVKPGRPLSTPRLRQLLRAALLLGLTEHCLQLLRRPEDSTTAEGPEAEERASLLALAVRQEQPVVVAEMVRCRELDGPPRFDPNETWVPAEGARLQLLLVYAARHCSTAIVAALLAGGANPNDDSGPDRLAGKELGCGVPLRLPAAGAKARLLLGCRAMLVHCGPVTCLPVGITLACRRRHWHDRAALGRDAGRRAHSQAAGGGWR